jgi:hypothetical protein
MAGNSIRKSRREYKHISLSPSIPRQIFRSPRYLMDFLPIRRRNRHTNHSCRRIANLCRPLHRNLCMKSCGARTVSLGRHNRKFLRMGLSEYDLEGRLRCSRRRRLRLEGSRLKRPFAIGRVATKATVCDWKGLGWFPSSRLGMRLAKLMLREIREAGVSRTGFPSRSLGTSVKKARRSGQSRPDGRLQQKYRAFLPARLAPVKPASGAAKESRLRESCRLPFRSRHPGTWASDGGSPC